MNLAVNARDAMPKGRMLTIQTENVVLDEKDGRISPELNAGEYIKLTVNDTGTGIDSQTINRIFEPFFTTKKTGKGTGLGLSLVYGIIAQSNGGISVYSELGTGTRFEIYLPRVEAEAQKDADADDLADQTQFQETILLVEDEDSVRELVLEGLTEWGYQVLVAANGEEALAICQNHGADIDLLLTDVVMPGISGCELAQQLQIKCSQIKMLYMTGYTDVVIAEHGLSKDADNLLRKPFTIGVLTNKVYEILNESESA